jgi:hypothetical protein
MGMEDARPWTYYCVPRIKFSEQKNSEILGATANRAVRILGDLDLFS